MSCGILMKTYEVPFVLAFPAAGLGAAPARRVSLGWRAADADGRGVPAGPERARRRLRSIARTLMGNPELLLLDEPSEGLAPLVVDLLREKISELKAHGLTILLAEQRVDFALALADRVYVLEKGAVRHSGAAAELRCDKALLDRLLSL